MWNVFYGKTGVYFTSSNPLKSSSARTAVEICSVRTVRFICTDWEGREVAIITSLLRRETLVRLEIQTVGIATTWLFIT